LAQDALQLYLHDNSGRQRVNYHLAETTSRHYAIIVNILFGSFFLQRIWIIFSMQTVIRISNEKTTRRIRTASTRCLHFAFTRVIVHKNSQFYFAGSHD